jgi:hypothetical protein
MMSAVRKAWTAAVTFGVVCGAFTLGGCRAGGQPRERGVLADALNLQRKDRTEATVNGAGGRAKHVVVMWLKKPGDSAGRRAILNATSSLRKIPGVVDVTAGECLPSDRSVVDSSYDVALVISFDTERAMKAYATDPAHEKLVEDVVKPNVEKYVVFDFLAR